MEDGVREDNVDRLGQLEIGEAGPDGYDVREAAIFNGLRDLRDHVGRAIDGVDAAAGQALEQVEGDGAGAAAGVEDGLVAAQVQVIDDGLRPAAHGRADAVVDVGVPVGGGLGHLLFIRRVRRCEYGHASVQLRQSYLSS